MLDQEKVEGEIVDERTKEIIPRGANEIPIPTEQKTIINVHQIGILDVDQQAVDAITAPLDENDVQIRPDGLVYLPWTWRAKRLNEAFGIFKWGMIPQGAPMSKNMDETTVLVVWGWWLVVKGVPVAFSYGETSYRPKNKTMSYADACEGAKSNALSRNCKQIGMPDIELYSQDWVKAWKAKHAERVKNPDGNYPEYIWRKKGQKQAPKSEQKATNTQNQTPVAQNSTQATEAVETTSEPAKEPVAPAGAEAYTGNQILGSKDGHLVKELVKMTGKATVDVCKVVGTLEKGHKYTLEYVKDMILAQKEA